MQPGQQGRGSGLQRGLKHRQSYLLAVLLLAQLLGGAAAAAQQQTTPAPRLAPAAGTTPAAAAQKRTTTTAAPKTAARGATTTTTTNTAARPKMIAAATSPAEDKKRIAAAAAGGRAVVAPAAAVGPAAVAARNRQRAATTPATSGSSSTRTRAAATAAAAGAATAAAGATAAARTKTAARAPAAARQSSSKATNTCDGKYGPGRNPLLFGGVGEQGRCLKDCQSRTDFWGKTCAFNSNSGWGVCNAQQARNAFNTVGRYLGGGEATRLAPCDLLPYLRGRTLWILGDSHSKSMYKALQCFLIDYWNHGECETSTDAAAVQQLFNLPERNGFQKCLHLLGPGGGRICIVEVVLGTSFVGNSKIPYGGVMPLLRRKFAQKQDIFYVNFGVWHKKKPEWWATLEPSLEALGRDFQANRADFPHMLFRETPAEHPKNNNGQTCLPMKGYFYRPSTDSLEVSAASRISVKGWNSGMSANTAAKEVLGRYGIPVVPTFAQSVPLHDNHIGTTMNPEQDCLHYCMPGVPQFWVYSLFDAMRAGKAGIRPVPSTRLASEGSSRNGQFTCIPNKIKF